MTDHPNNIDIHGSVTGGNVNIGGTQNFSVLVVNESSHPDTTSDIPVETVIETFNAASARLKNIRATFADTEISVRRDDVQKIIDWVGQKPSNEEEPRHRLALVTGKPGQGKSVVMQQLASALREAGYVVLGIKADDLSVMTQPLLSLSDLQNLLQLPAPIEQCVRTVAEVNTCIVVVDQLDTLALTLNTNEQSLRVVVNLIDRLRDTPNVQIIVSCRDFERTNDPVLGGIKIDQSFSIEELREDQVNDVLQSLGQPQLQDLPRPLQHLLRTPLYLDIYAQLVLSGESTDLARLTTLQDLYQQLWALRIERSDQNAPPPAERRQAVYHLVELMAKQRNLKISISYCDEYPTVRQYLLRTGFVHKEGHTLSFLHQTLFSYCYARKFVSDQRSLSTEVFASPQGFFERQLIVEIIQHLRSTDLGAYHIEIEALLFPSESVRVRYHLRLLLLRWLAWQPEPTDLEYSLIARLERFNLDEFQRWLSITGSNRGWFQRLEKDVPRWLDSSDNRVVEMAIRYLANFRDTLTESVIKHIKPYLDRSKEWNRRISFILLYLKNWRDGNDAIELLMHLVRNRDVSIQQSNYALVDMAYSNAVAGCQLLRLHAELRFREYLELAKEQNDPYARPFQGDILKDAVDSWEARGFISVVAQSNPQAIRDILLPWFVETVVALTEERETSSSYYPSNLLFYDLHEMPSAHDREGISFVQGILQALSHLARTVPEAFRQKVAELAPKEARIIQQLLLCAFRANPSELVEDIYCFLTTDHRRLYIQPDAGLLLGAAYTCSNQSLRNKWESFIFSVYQNRVANEEVKSLEDWRRNFRSEQRLMLDLLWNIDDSILSDYARHKKQEILRLPEFEYFKPSTHWGSIYGGTVEAPVPTNKQENLSDADWLRILHKYNDETDWDKPRKRRRILEGGVVEMSRALQEQVKSNPERFYDLSKKFDENISAQYIEAVIHGLAHNEASVSPEWVFGLFRRFHSKITGYTRIGVGNALAKMAPAEVPADIVDILVTWAQDDPDPDAKDEQQKLVEILSRSTPHSDGLINLAINSVRSSALEDVCRILFSKEIVPLERIFEIIQRGVEDTCASVRTMAVQQLARWQNVSKDRDRSIELFKTAIEGHIVLLTSHPVHNFLHWLSFTYPEQALPYLQLMLTIPHEHTQYMGAQLVCVAGLYDKDDFKVLASNLHKSENPAIRRGTAVIYAQEINNPEKVVICCERLLILMEDVEDQVRLQTTQCFRRLNTEHLLQFQNFFRQFIRSSALQAGGIDFVSYLTRANLVTPEEQRLSLSLVRNVLEAVSTNLGSNDRRYFRLQRELTLYLRNLYDKSIDRSIRANIMDLFDEMLRLGSDEAHSMLQVEDIEWLPQLK